MATCFNGHDVLASTVFCHDCGAPMPKAPPSNTLLYVSIASVVVIVLGLIGIVWVLTNHDDAREAAEVEAGLSICGDVPTQRPTTISLACGTTGATLTDVTWSQWSDRSATGTGTYTTGSTTLPATVILGGATKTAAGAQFTQMTVTPQGAQALRQPIAVYPPTTTRVNASARVPSGGALCPSKGARRIGVLGKHTSCDFADQVRHAYLAAGGHGQALTVSATSTITHQTYRNIACSGGRYVVCVGGEGNTARVFFGPFE